MQNMREQQDAGAFEDGHELKLPGDRGPDGSGKATSSSTKGANASGNVGNGTAASAGACGAKQ